MRYFAVIFESREWLMETYAVDIGKVNTQAVMGSTMYPYVRFNDDFCPDSRIRLNLTIKSATPFGFKDL